MFINCPHCNALVATDPATDLPPPRCPRCAVVLSEEATPPKPDAADTRPAQAADATPANDPLVEAVAAAASPTPTAENDTIEALAHTPVPLAPDIDGLGQAATTPDTPPQVDEARASPDVEGTGTHETVPGDASATESVDGGTATISDPETATESETGDIARMDPEPSPTGPLANTGPAADIDSHQGPAPEGSAVPATPTPVSAEADRPEAEPQAETEPDPVTDPTTAGAIDDTDAASGSRPDVDPDPVLGPDPDPDPEPAPTPVPAPASSKAAPSFARVRAPAAAASGQRRWLLPALIAGLSLLLALQWVLADRGQLAADARWRPLVAQLCGVLRCSLPPWREAGAFTLLDRDVRPHPSVPGALRVSATFRNDARWAQAWPEVVLTLSDVEGRAVGARAFAASEYLGTMPMQNEIASGQAATIRMDVLEPAPRIVAFAFDFR